jgi:hypothetical protein
MPALFKIISNPFQSLGGVDVELFKIVADKFQLNVTFRSERAWLSELENGTLVGTVQSVRSFNFLLVDFRFGQTIWMKL